MHSSSSQQKKKKKICVLVKGGLELELYEISALEGQSSSPSLTFLMMMTAQKLRSEEKKKERARQAKVNKGKWSRRCIEEKSKIQLQPVNQVVNHARIRSPY